MVIAKRGLSLSLALASNIQRTPLGLTYSLRGKYCGSSANGRVGEGQAALETALREPRRAAQERDDYSSFSAGGREGDEVPRE